MPETQLSVPLAARLLLTFWIISVSNNGAALEHQALRESLAAAALGSTDGSVSLTLA